MQLRTSKRAAYAAIIVIILLSLTACSVSAPALTGSNAAKPDWFNIKMTDVRTGQTFTVNDFAGKVVLVETMATWCITCIEQQMEVKKMESQISNPKDLVVISLDTDLNEDAATLKEYANSYGFDWHFAISPLEVDRALGNLYSSAFMNPPLAPMLFVDRHGSVYSLPFGTVKKAAALQDTLAPHLAVQ
jgi:thiol-disulfide isomerase/thioredoxin